MAVEDGAASDALSEAGFTDVAPAGVADVAPAGVTAVPLAGVAVALADAFAGDVKDKIC